MQKKTTFKKCVFVTPRPTNKNKLLDKIKNKAKSIVILAEEAKGSEEEDLLVGFIHDRLEEIDNILTSNF